MASRLGSVLPRKSVAWFWFILAAAPAAYFSWRAITSDGSWSLPVVLGVVAALVVLEPRFRKRGVETVQVDDSGVLRKDGNLHEQIAWGEVQEIRIITTDEGPFQEDVFFVLVGGEGKGCLVPHDAAVRTQLLEELHSRFPGLDDAMVIKAMASTSNNSFVIWKAGGAAS